MKLDLNFYQTIFLLGSCLALTLTCLALFKKRAHYGKVFQALVVALVVFLWPSSFLSLSVYNLERSHSVEFCGSCHQMTKHIDDVTNPNSLSLAAKHTQRRWINKNPCYTCHTDYALFGPLLSKWRGLQHFYAAVFVEQNEEDITMYEPYKDSNCLQCHQTPRFEKVEAHQDADPDELCVACHDKIHKVKK